MLQCKNLNISPCSNREQETTTIQTKHTDKTPKQIKHDKHKTSEMQNTQIIIQLESYLQF